MHDKVAPSELERILERVEARLPLEKCVWDGDLGDTETHDSRASFESELLAFSRMKHAYTLLIELEKTMRPIIDQLSERLLEPSRQFGIDKLPDSVLALIFETSVRSALLVVEDRSFSSACRDERLALALTSRRFASIARSTPSLWACITIQTVKPVTIEEPSHLRKSAPLVVELRTSSGLIEERNLPNPVHCCRALFLRTIFRSDVSSGAMKGGDVLPKDEQARILPNIESLDIYGRDTFFDLWQTPNVKHLYLGYILPPQRIACNLTTLAIRSDWRCSEHEVVTSDFAPFQFLRYTRKLQRLSLYLVTIRSTSFKEPEARTDLQAATLEDIDLPHLTSLEVDAVCLMQFEEHVFRAVRLLTDPMQVPELRDLKLRYTTRKWLVEEDQIPFRDKRLDKLQTLSLEITQFNEQCASRPKTKKDVEYFESEAQKTRAFITGLLVGRSSLMEVSIVSQKCTNLFDYISACPSIRLFRFEGRFLDNVKALSETVKGVYDSKPNLQYCEVRTAAFSGRGRKKSFVRLDENVGPTRFVWNEERLFRH